MKNKRKFILTSNDYINKPMPTDMILTIKKVQTKLQTQENIKYGRKAACVSFVYAAKVLNKLITKHLDEVLR